MRDKDITIYDLIDLKRAENKKKYAHLSKEEREKLFKKLREEFKIKYQKSNFGGNYKEYFINYYALVSKEEQERIEYTIGLSTNLLPEEQQKEEERIRKILKKENLKEERREKKFLSKLTDKEKNIRDKLNSLTWHINSLRSLEKGVSRWNFGRSWEVIRKERKPNNKEEEKFVKDYFKSRKKINNKIKEGYSRIKNEFKLEELKKILRRDELGKVLTILTIADKNLIPKIEELYG